MLLIWGTRRTVQTILMLTMLCGRCGNPAAHAVKHLVTKFTFFFIPLFPISSRYLTQCTFCGHSQRATKEQVEQLKLSQQPSVSEYPQHGGMPAPAPQGGMPALPPGQAPQPQLGAAPGYPQGAGSAQQYPPQSPPAAR